MYPEIENGKAECTNLVVGNGDSAPLGLLDSVNIHLDPKIDQALKEHYIPIASLKIESFINANMIGKILIQLVNYFQWTRFSIVYTNEESSIHVIKMLGQLGTAGKICLSAVEPLPVLSKSDQSEEAHMKVFNFLLQSLTSKSDPDSPIIVIGSGLSVEKFTQVLTDNLDLVSKFQWFFSSMPSPKIIQSMAPMIERVSTLSPYPGTINELEKFWKAEENSNQSHYSLFHNSVKDCDDSECVKMSELDVLWRTYQSLPIVHSIFTFAHAIRNAWIDSCKGTRGLCQSLQKMPRRTFVSNFLETLNFEYNPSLRSPPELKGRKHRPLQKNNFDDIIQLALTTFTLSSNQVIKINQVIAYQSSEEPLILIKNHHIIPSLCPDDGCKSCVKIRQSRFEDTSNVDGEDMNNIFDDSSHVIINEKSANVIIPLVLPIHKKGKTELECLEELNLPAIYELEAAFWALDQMNRDQSRRLKYGLYVIDSCSSNLKISQRLSNFFISKVDKKLGTISIHDALSFISSLPADQSQSLIQFLKPLNVSLVSSQDLTALGLPLGSDHYLFQTAVPYKNFIEATIEQLRYFGWSYVSFLVLKDNDETDAILTTFMEHAKEAGICAATIASLDKSDLLNSAQSSLIKLKHAKAAGARVVIIIADTTSTRAFMATFKKFVESGSLKRDEFIWILTGESNLNIVSGLEEECLGMLVVRESQSSIKSFIDHFGTLTLENNFRNPWFSKFLEQMTNCQAHDCNAKLMNPISATNVVQSLVSLIVGFNQLRDEICGSKQKGLCGTLISNSNLRELISKYVHFTPINIKFGLKESKEKFSFTKDGFGSKSVDILNFKRDSTNGQFRFEQVAMFKSKFKKLDSTDYVFYDENAKESVMEVIKSDCTIPEICSEQCPKNDLNYLVLDSPSNLYIAAAIPVHQPSPLNLFQCGPIDYQGLQLVEAFLWALDYINDHPSVLPDIKLGAIIIDTCTSHQKAGRDISNVLSNHFQTDLFFKNNLPNSKDILTLIVNSEEVKLIDTVLDITLPLGLTTLAPIASHSKYDDLSQYSQLIRFSLSNQVYSDSLISLLIYYQWTYVSVIYKDDQNFLKNVFQDFKMKTNLADIEIGVEEKMTNLYNAASIRTLIARLDEGAKFGSKVIILLLDNEQLMNFFAEAKRMQDSGQINWTNLDAKQIMFITIDGREALNKYSDFSLGALSIIKPSESVPNFKDYFINLNIRNNSRNPWFKEYWQSINNCFGAACFSKLENILLNQSYISDRNIASMVNSVFAFAKGLSAAQRTLCPTRSYQNCPELDHVSKSSNVLNDLIKSSVFIGGSGRTIKFLENSNYALENLNVYILGHITPTTVAFINLGKFNEKDGLFVNTTKVRAYDGLNFDKEMKKFVSKYQGHLNGVPKFTQVLPADSNMLSIFNYPTSNRFMIGALLSIHKRGSSLFKCGEIDIESMFQNLVAFNYALEMVNSNTSSDDIKFGGLVVDVCGRKERAEEKLLNYFSEKNADRKKVSSSKALVAMVSYSQEIGQEVDQILRLHQITHLIIPVEKLQDDSNFNDNEIKAIRTIPKRSALIDALVDLIDQLGWTYVHLVHSNVEERNRFVSTAAIRKICVAKEIDLLSVSNNVTIMLKTLNDNLSQSKEAQVVVNLLDDQINGILFTSTFQDLIKK